MQRNNETVVYYIKEFLGQFFNVEMIIATQKMKLVYITNSKIPSERANALQVMKMCDAFANYADITLLFPFRFQVNDRMKLIKDVYSYYNCTNEFNMVKIFSLDFHPISLNPTFNKIAYYIQAFSFSLLALIRSLFLEKDVYYTRDSIPAFLLTFSRFLHKKKVYFEVHGVPRGLEGLFFKYSIINVNGIITISNNLQEEIKSLYNIKNIIAEHDGVDTKLFHKDIKFDIYQELEISKGQNILVYVGHLYPWKGVDDVVEAIRNKKKISFIVVGGLENDIDDLKSKSPKHVYFVGYKPPIEVVKFMNAADLLILPSKLIGNNISESFTSPLKLFEYLAVGKPIIASNHPAYSAILPRGVIKYKMSDLSDLSKKIDYSIKNKTRLKIIAKNYPKYVKKFTWNMRAKRIINFMNLDYFENKYHP